MHEADLVRGLKEGREAALDGLIHAYGPQLFRYALVILGTEEDAKDIVQETFIRAFRQGGMLREAAGLKGWLYKITLNLCRDVLRTRGRREKIAGENFENEAILSPSAEDEYMLLAKSAALREALLHIPVHYREIIVLYYYKDFSILEICRITGKPEGTVKSLPSLQRKIWRDLKKRR